MASLLSNVYYLYSNFSIKANDNKLQPKQLKLPKFETKRPNENDFEILQKTNENRSMSHVSTNEPQLPDFAHKVSLSIASREKYKFSWRTVLISVLS
mmetsp:Transcript_21641/g.24890  ORF Transcript_21641/g.24890 Transcript_21641/m.24890 type:complete len:97 (-) Transcript_21641:385-675(-)